MATIRSAALTAPRRSTTVATAAAASRAEAALAAECAAQASRQDGMKERLREETSAKAHAERAVLEARHEVPRT